MTAGMRRSARAWKKIVAEFGESVYHHLAVARAVACRMLPELYVGRYLGHHARAGSILIMTSDGVVKAAVFRRMNEESRWNVENWNAFRGLSLGCNRNGSRSYSGYPRPTTSNHPSAFDATSALCHQGRLEETRCDDRLLSVF